MKLAPSNCRWFGAAVGFGRAVDGDTVVAFDGFVGVGVGGVVDVFAVDDVVIGVGGLTVVVVVVVVEDVVVRGVVDLGVVPLVGAGVIVDVLVVTVGGGGGGGEEGLAKNRMITFKNW